MLLPEQNGSGFFQGSISNIERSNAATSGAAAFVTLDTCRTGLPARYSTTLTRPVSRFAESSLERKLTSQVAGPSGSDVVATVEVVLEDATFRIDGVVSGAASAG
jgi:hypothetical protein